MKKSVIIDIFVLVVCLVLTSSARAEIVDANDEWLMPLGPYQTITCVAQFIPDINVVPESLIFKKAPAWTDTYPFDYVSAGWDTVVSGDGKMAYLYGTAITNDTPFSWDLFSYSLFYQWDTEDPNYNEIYPVWVDIAVFNGPELVVDGSVRGIPGGPWDYINDVTWREQYGGDPYENPVPEPMTICLLGLGSLFLKKRQRPSYSI
jgi:hypothetical protein